MTDWSKPIALDDATQVFPTNVEGVYLPPREEIPKKFRNIFVRGVPAIHLAMEWFYKGLDKAEFTPREGVDQKTALRQVSACLRSFQPKQEDKIGGVAYLLSLFFSKVNANGQEWVLDLPETEGA